MTLQTWSRTAATNATADGTINLAEGMAASAVNDSNRAMMAAVAKYRDDTCGSLITTGGTSSAYTITSFEVLTAHTDGFVVAFIAHAANAAGPTLNVDGRGAKPLRSQTGVSLPAGALVAGSVYSAVYESGNEEWLLRGIALTPGLALLASNTDSATSQVNITSGFSSIYNSYVFEIVEFVPATDGAACEVRVGTGGSFLVGSSDYHYGYNAIDPTGAATATSAASGSSGATSAQISSNVGSAATESLSARIELFNTNSTTKYKVATFQASGIRSNGEVRIVNGGFSVHNTGALDRIGVRAGSGNCSATIKLYGKV